MTDQPLTKITSDHLSVDIHPLGAQLFSLCDRTGRDLQWNGDPRVWNGRAPILFPIVGALNRNLYRIDGKVFALPRHGFARARLFSLAESTSVSARFRLRWDEETFKIYPFKFELDVHYALTDATLHIVATVKNLENERTLPASFGFHPAFRWPLPYGESRSVHVVRFEKDEPAPIRRITPEGLMLHRTFATPVVDRELQLHDDLFKADVVIFDEIASRRVRYGAHRGPRLEIAFPGMSALGIWTKPGADFICIEPWHGLPDPHDYLGDVRLKPGIALLPPGTAKEFAMSISLLAE